MKMIATSLHTNTISITSIYPTEIDRRSASQAHTTYLRRAEKGLRRDLREERGQIREGRVYFAILP